MLFIITYSHRIFIIIFLTDYSNFFTGNILLFSKHLSNCAHVQITQLLHHFLNYVLARKNAHPITFPGLSEVSQSDHISNYGITSEKLISLTRDHNIAALTSYGGVS